MTSRRLGNSSASRQGFHRMHRTGFLLTIGVLAIWAVLAVRNPDLTYHFAPILAAVAWPLSIRRSEPQPAPAAAQVGAASFVVVAAASVVLWFGDKLMGPTLWSDDGAIIEAMLFAALGAALGVRVATRERAGLLGKLFTE